MTYLEAVDLDKLKSQVLCFSGESSLNHDKKKEIIGQRQQVLVEVLVLMQVTKSLVRQTSNLSSSLSFAGSCYLIFS